MKITKIDVLLVTTANPIWRPILCRIHTDEGIYGDGEAAVAYISSQTAAFGMIQDLARFIIGMDPLQNEVIWDKLYKTTFWGQNGGPVVFAGISALDIALWDIKGKFFNAPLHVLLGGKRRDKLRAYASQLQFGWEMDWPEAATGIPQRSAQDYANVCKKAMAEGYDAVKIDFFTFDKTGEGYQQFTEEERTRLIKPYYLNMIEERLSAIREACGPDLDIIIENHSFPDAQGAVQIGQMAEKYRIMYFEEPNTPTPYMQKYIADKVNIPQASGERIYSRWQYAPYFENKSLQVIQPDIGNCGGLTEAKKICDMAYTYDVSVQAHVCATPLSTSVALHLEAVIPNFVIHEHHVNNRCIFNYGLAKYNPQPEKGYIAVPNEPGIGNEITEQAYRQAQVAVIR
ncbi:MAG: mandelate racemase/muconate lactonizing enzyme family protein [Clostridiales bacterium]